MTCKHVTNRLSDLALGALDGQRRAEAEALVDRCPSCRAALERERKLMAAIDREVAGHVGTEPSPDFAARARMRLATEAVAPGFSPAWRLAVGGWSRAAAIALAAVMVIGAVWLARRREPCRGAGCSGRVPSVASGATRTARGTGSVLAEAGVNRSGAVGARKTAARTHSLRSGQAPPQVQREGLPEVIVDRNEQQSIVRLYCSLQAGRVDLVSFMAVPPGFRRQADGWLVATPLEIEPAEPPSSDAGSGAVESSPQPLR